jgi:hypothetical protein
MSIVLSVGVAIVVMMTINEYPQDLLLAS